MNDVQAVLFDYGMVLSGPPDPAAKRQMAELLAVDDETFRTAYWADRDAYDRGTLSGEGFWRGVASLLSRPVGDPVLAQLIAADTALWTQPNADMIAWAAELRRCGIKTGILSNLGDAMEDGIRAKFAWLSDFDHHTFSHRLGIAKPDQAIYAHAVQGLGVPAANILFVDDRIENIEAARDAGMLALHYSGHAAFVAEMKQMGLESLLTPCAKL